MTAVRTVLLTEAAEWRLLGLLFEYPAGEWQQQVAALAREVADPLLSEAASLALAGATEGAHHSIFGPGGPAPAREASYRTGVQLGYLMAEISSVYEAFGYHPASPESPDHAAVEIGFIAYLKLKQVYAESGGREEEARLCQQAVDYFTREHLSVIAAPLAERLEPSAPAWLALAGRALLERAGPPEAVPAFPLPDLEDDELTCAAAPPADSSLIQLSRQENSHE